jgi:uncharacterized lipoprotein YajG
LSDKAILPAGELFNAGNRNRWAGWQGEAMKPFTMTQLFILAGFALTVSGCALTTDRIDVPYQPVGAVAPVADASASSVSVASRDARSTYRDRVSTKKNGYGMEMAAILATNDIPQTVTGALTQTLTAEGYRIGPGHAAMAIDVLRFYNDFKIGFFSGDALADVELMVTIRDPANNIVFSRNYVGEGKEADVMLASGSNARAALIRAFQNVVNSIAGDQALHAAIKAAQQPGSAIVTTPGS